MTAPPGHWAQALFRFGTTARPRRDPDGEQLWLRPSERNWIDLRLPRMATYLLICPKSPPVDWWSAEKSLPRDVAVFCGPYPTERRGLPILKALLRLATGAVFVGDMDPYSVVQYVETARMLSGAKRPSLLYGGVNDAWLDSMERTLSRRTRLERLLIPLAKHEISLLKDLERVVDLEKLIEPRGCSVLRSGYKIELEGATAPRLYDGRHGRWVFRYLRSRIVQHARHGK